jgi:proteasome lid subunit RPN8/RPN11
MMNTLDLKSCESACERVRRGEVDELSGSFLSEPPGFLGLFKGSKKPDIEDVRLLAASEALLFKGHPRKAIDPLEELIGSSRAEMALKIVAMSRAGQIAVQHGLPMDLGPIVSELGLSRRDLSSALRSYMRKRQSKDLLPEMERAILQALLLDDRADMVESQSLAVDHLRGAYDGYERAISLAGEMKGDPAKFHSCRALLLSSTFMLKRGEMAQGYGRLEDSIERCRENDFPYLLMKALILDGLYDEDPITADKGLVEAALIAEILGNQRAMAECLYVRGSRACANEMWPDMGRDPVDLILESAEMMERSETALEGARYRLEGALWSIRKGDPKRGLEEARKAHRHLRGSDDRESMIMSLCMIFFAHIRMDDRRRAKSGLLELVMNQPVKQFPSCFSVLREAVSGVDWLREDRKTRELFEDEVVYTIENDAVDEIITRAKEAYPNEFGAMLRGIPHITHIEPVMEGAGNRNSFLFSLYSRFSQRNVEGEGVVHSHPSGSARPSRADLSMFGRFPGINIIIGYPFKPDSMAAYDRLGNRVKLEIMKDGRKRK